MSLYLCKKETVFVYRNGKWVNETLNVQTPFTPLPFPFSPNFVLDHLADNVNVTSVDIVQQVIENVRNGKQDGRIYGVYDRTSFGDTRSEVKYSDLMLK
jgi:hypothetical protein